MGSEIDLIKYYKGNNFVVIDFYRFLMVNIWYYNFYSFKWYIDVDFDVFFRNKINSLIVIFY